jgi:hypothetical protein
VHQFTFWQFACHALLCASTSRLVGLSITVKSLLLLFMIDYF